MKRLRKSQALQQLLNCEKNGYKTGDILWCVRGDFGTEMFGADGLVALPEELNFAVVSKRGTLALYKTNTAHNRVAGEAIVEGCCSFLVRKKDSGEWVLETLLKDGDELHKARVDEAFKNLCAYCDYKVLQSPELYNIQTKDGRELSAWASIVSMNSTWSVLACNIDNGQIEAIALADISIRRIKEGPVCTAYNRFRLEGSDLI